MTNEKHLPKDKIQKEFDYGSFTNLSRIIFACDFFRVHSNSNEGPTSLDKISSLTWKLLVISSQDFSCELNFQELSPCKMPPEKHVTNCNEMGKSIYDEVINACCMIINVRNIRCKYSIYKNQCMIIGMMLHPFQDNTGICQLTQNLKIC